MEFSFIFCYLPTVNKVCAAAAKPNLGTSANKTAFQIVLLVLCLVFILKLNSRLSREWIVGNSLTSAKRLVIELARSTYSV
jgi:hypothetical protein